MSMESETCPCCGSFEMLRHVRAGGVYWFCMSCRQEVPLLRSVLEHQRKGRAIAPRLPR